MPKLNSIVITPVSHDSSEIILICRFAAQEIQYYQCWKQLNTVLLNIFVDMMIVLKFLSLEISLTSLFKLCILNASLLNKNNIFLFFYKKKIVIKHFTSSTLGRGTLTARHLLLMGAITFEVELQHRISRQVDMYFSIVRRKACWASLVRRSTSVSSTTVKTWEMLSLPNRLYYCCVSVRLINIKLSNPDTALSYLTFRLII